MAQEVKKLKDTKGKDLDAALKKAKAGGKKDEIEAAQKILDTFNKEVGELDRKAKNLPEIARRMMQSEIQHLADDKLAPASVTSPLGTQSSKQFRLLGDARALDIPKEQDPR